MKKEISDRELEYTLEFLDQVRSGEFTESVPTEHDPTNRTDYQIDYVDYAETVSLQSFCN